VSASNPLTTEVPGEVAGPVLPPEARAVARTRRSRLLASFRRLLRSRTFVVGAGIVAFWILIAILWPLVAPYSPTQIDANATLAPPSGAHWLGTDSLGRDVLSRMMAGATTVLTIGALAAIVGVGGGVLLGLVMGYFGGIVDDGLGRIVDALLAIPLVVIALFVVASIGKGTLNLVLLIGFLFVPAVARTIRAAVLTQRNRDYIAAAKLRGESNRWILFGEILPNITEPISVELTIRIGYAIFIAATLSFLGLGLQPPSPDWGLSISDGRTVLQPAPWVAAAPAVALASLVIGLNLMADGAREANDL
jgi:peptide/nickel transport system permease protein